MRFRILLVLVLSFSAVFAALADEADDQDFQAPYTDVPTLRGDDGAFIIGDPDAPVTVIEFADYLCPFCQEYHATSTQFIEEYVLTGQARYEYRFFNIIDPEFSSLASMVAECAYEQGQFWTAHGEIYRLASDRAITSDLATTVGENLDEIDAEALVACTGEMRLFQYMEDGFYANELGVTGTPAIRVRVGDNEAGVLTINGDAYMRGGVALDVLSAFVTADSPADLIDLPNRVVRDDYLPDASLVDPDACEAPCWRDITPGETTFDEALELLEAMDDVGELAVQDAGEVRFVTFGETPCCQIVSEQDNIVTIMQINTAPLMQIGEVLERYGEPVYVDGAPFTSRQIIFNFYFPDYSFVAFVFAESMDEVPTDESIIIGAVYLEPSVFEDILQASSLYAWDGYLSLNDYRSGDFAITPQ